MGFYCGMRIPFIAMMSLIALKVMSYWKTCCLLLMTRSKWITTIRLIHSIITSMSCMASLLQVARQRDRYTKVFGLYALPSRDSVLETRAPAPLPQEQHGLRVLVKVMDLRWAWLYHQGVWLPFVNSAG